MSTVAVSKWINGSATPTEKMQEVIASRFAIPQQWWRNAPPSNDGELLATCWLLGLAKPDEEHRLKMQKAFGIDPAAWDQPAA